MAHSHIFRLILMSGMKKIFLGLVCLGFATMTLAQEWNLRNADIPLDHFSATQLTAGSTLTFPDDSQSKFSVGGAYSFTLSNNRGTDFGLFSVESDGRVCIDFRNDTRQCNLFVRSGGLIVMLSDTGQRFPVKVHLTLSP